MKSSEKNPIIWIAWFLYLAFVIYGSLIPFQLKGNVPHNFFEVLHNLFFGHSLHEYISGADVLANFLFYLPLGFLSVTLIFQNGGGIFLSFIISCVLSSALSLTVEAFQTYIVSRTSSVSDIAANTLGGTLGAFLAGIFFLLFYQPSRKFGARLVFECPLLIVTIIYGVILFLGSLFPFDISIQPSDIGAALRHSEWFPFSSHSMASASLYNLGSELLLYSGFSSLCYLSLRLYKRVLPIPSFFAISFTAILGIAIEFSQLFIASRSSKLSDVIVALLGGIFGSLVASIVFKYLLSEKSSSAALPSVPTNPYRFFYVKLLFSVGYAPVVAYFLLEPLKFNTSRNLVVTKVSWKALIPFYAYWVKTDLWALQDLLFTYLIYVPFGGLLYYAFRPFKHAKRTALFICILLSIGIELAQFFEPGRYPDLTDVISGTTET